MSHSPLPWPVDAHVHFHALERVAPTLDAAAENFSAAAGGGRKCAHGALLLVQSSSERVFETVRGLSSVGAWQLSPALAEVQTVVARRDETCLAVICGRQVRASDGLEVLALGTCEEFPDGLPFADIVSSVCRSGAITVVPWGFGKWLGGRGRRMKAVLQATGREALYVGDNGGRLEALGVPAGVRTLEQRGFRVLPGTDPFPFGADHRRVGSLGFMTNAEFDEAAPWRRLQAWLNDQSASPPPYGRGSSPIRFVVNQVGIHLYKGAASRREGRA